MKIQIVFIVLIFLSSCSTSSLINDSEPTISEGHQAEQSNETKYLDGDEEATPNSPGNSNENTQAKVGESALALLEKAQTQAEAGQPELAAATLERAINIEPDNPWLWHRLAVLRMQQRQWSESIALANRSIGLARGNKRLIGGNWLVISLALEGAGKNEAAIQAKKNSDAFLDAK